MPVYSEDDLNSAIAAGAISRQSAQALRDHVAHLRGMPRGSEENFRLLNSFNDIFVTIAAVLLMVAVGSIGALVFAPLGALAVAALAWALSEYFALKRRMALPSIVLALAFIGGCAVFPILLGSALQMEEGWFAIPAGPLAAVAAFAHWRRFRVPITIAAGAAALIVMAIVGLLAIVEQFAGVLAQTMTTPLVFIGGLITFGFAMAWDTQDPQRLTRRSDVAFWLHLLAAPLIIHPLFSFYGVFSGVGTNMWGAVAILATYVVLGLVALAIDRRALLVSALAYVLYALGEVVQAFGAIEASVSITTLVIGSALLMLSTFWTKLRMRVVPLVPAELRAKLPPLSPDMDNAQVAAG